jgi:hypothetical protein
MYLSALQITVSLQDTTPYRSPEDLTSMYLFVNSKLVQVIMIQNCFLLSRKDTNNIYMCVEMKFHQAVFMHAYVYVWNEPFRKLTASLP